MIARLHLLEALPKNPKANLPKAFVHQDAHGDLVILLPEATIDALCLVPDQMLDITVQADGTLLLKPL